MLSSNSASSVCGIGRPRLRAVCFFNRAGYPDLGRAPHFGKFAPLRPPRPRQNERGLSAPARNARQSPKSPPGRGCARRLCTREGEKQYAVVSPFPAAFRQQFEIVDFHSLARLLLHKKQQRKQKGDGHEDQITAAQCFPRRTDNGLRLRRRASQGHHSGHRRHHCRFRAVEHPADGLQGRRPHGTAAHRRRDLHLHHSQGVGRTDRQHRKRQSYL